MLVDTSIWIDHLRQGDAGLAQALQSELVWTHSFVLGELACGNLRSREEVMDLLQALPRLATVSDKEALFFIEEHRLMGQGIGYVDAHLLASVRLAGVSLWTRDKRLLTVATELSLAHANSRH